MHNSELFILHLAFSFLFFSFLALRRERKQHPYATSVHRTFVAVVEGKRAGLRTYVTQSPNGFIML